VQTGQHSRQTLVIAGEYLVILRDGTKLPSSRTYRDKLHQALNLAS
jgi:DNA-binding LytR/AlgR family response regulator